MVAAVGGMVVIVVMVGYMVMVVVMVVITVVVEEGAVTHGVITGQSRQPQPPLTV